MKRKLTLGGLIMLAFCTLSFTAWAGNGTGLSVVLTLVNQICNANGTADVTVSYSVVSTGAADAATVTYTVDGGAVQSLPSIAAGNIDDGGGWTFDGRTKTAGGQFTLTLASGGHSIEVCGVQNGSNGNEDKLACQTLNVVVQCSSTNACERVTEVFGEVPSNKNVCKNNTPVQIQFKGNFGDPALMSITGPKSFNSGPIQVNRSGDSCVYHYNWFPATNGGAGTYQFSINNGQFTFSADLSCSSR